MSHICAAVGAFPVQLIVDKGDRRARAHELLSPAGGTASSAKNATSVKDAVS